jgi:uncharacterized membrane protein YgaE (UPF0421/DUF939 family)
MVIIVSSQIQAKKRRQSGKMNQVTSLNRQLVSLLRQWGVLIGIIVSILINVVLFLEKRSSLVVKTHYVTELTELNANIFNVTKDINDARQRIIGMEYEQNRSASYVASIDHQKQLLNDDQQQLGDLEARRNDVEAQLSCR